MAGRTRTAALWFSRYVVVKSLLSSPRQSNMPNPPKLFGALLALLGLALAGAGLHMSVNLGGGAYFVVVGLLIAATGALLFLGRAAALWVYAVALAVVWLWSLQDSGGRMGELLPRVAMPTLLGLYLFSARIRERLS
jgi:quinoprotein glucose dehydrogenase